MNTAQKSKIELVDVALIKDEWLTEPDLISDDLDVPESSGGDALVARFQF